MRLPPDLPLAHLRESFLLNGGLSLRDSQVEAEAFLLPIGQRLTVLRA
jgi:hypothetical protein